MACRMKKHVPTLVLVGFRCPATGLMVVGESVERVADTLLKGLTGFLAHVCRQKYHEKTESIWEIGRSARSSRQPWPLTLSTEPPNTHLHALLALTRAFPGSSVSGVGVDLWLRWG